MTAVCLRFFYKIGCLYQQRRVVTVCVCVYVEVCSLCHVRKKYTHKHAWRHIDSTNICSISVRLQLSLTTALLPLSYFKKNHPSVEFAFNFAQLYCTPPIPGLLYSWTFAATLIKTLTSWFFLFFPLHTCNPLGFLCGPSWVLINTNFPPPQLTPLS